MCHTDSGVTWVTKACEFPFVHLFLCLFITHAFIHSLMMSVYIIDRLYSDESDPVPTLGGPRM